jgi:hypothetical protein
MKDYFIAIYFHLYPLMGLRKSRILAEPFWTINNEAI